MLKLADYRTGVIAIMRDEYHPKLLDCFTEPITLLSKGVISARIKNYRLRIRANPVFYALHE